MQFYDNSVNRSIYQSMWPNGVTDSPTTGDPAKGYAGFYAVKATTVSFTDAGGVARTNVSLFQGQYVPMYVENFSSTALGDVWLVNFEPAPTP